MQLSVLLLALAALLATVAAFKLKLWQFILLVACGLLALGFTGLLARPLASALLLLFLIVMLPLSIPQLRRTLLTGRLFAWFKRMLPPLSQTEQIAIDAGTVWWDRDLFTGDPDWEKLLKVPAPTLSPEEQSFIDGPTEKLCAMLDDWQITGELNDLPPEVWEFIKKNKFFGMIVPKEYGGLGFSALANSTVVMKIASRSITAGVTVMVPNSLGPGELLVHYGTQDQRDYYLPRLASGDEIPCFALTAPTAGSDAGAIPDRGVVCYGEYKGEQVLGLRVTWEKRYITLGPVATVLGLAFKAYDPDRLLGKEEELGITCALIPTDTPGVNIGNRHLPLNTPFMNGPNSGKDVFIPMDWVIGKEKGVGDGWRMLMGCLAAGRAISLPAMGVAAGKSCSRFTGAYARVRRQFKLPIGRFEGVQEALARIGGLTYMMDAARRLTAGAIDLGEKPTVLSAILKYHNTEAMRTVVNDSMDVLGGKGICLGPKNFMGRAYQAIPISITVEGANILTRSMIIFGQGVFRCHPYVLSELDAVADPDSRSGLAKFDRALMGHIGYTIRNAIRTLLLGLTAGRVFAKVPAAAAPVTARHYRYLSRFCAAFTLLADVSMLLLGGRLKRKESLSARLGDCLSYLYYGSAVLKRFEDTGRPEEDLPLLRWSMWYCLHNIQRALLGIVNNYPVRIIGNLLRWTIFPLGAHFQPPSDRLGQSVAGMLLRTGAARDRLTEGIFISRDADDVTGCLEQAMQLVIEAGAVENRVYKAARFIYQSPDDEPGLLQAVHDGLVSEEEAELLRRAVAATLKVIHVDDFSPQQIDQAVVPPAQGRGHDTRAA
jgi:acyl-CoA dehydrogenase